MHGVNMNEKKAIYLLISVALVWGASCTLMKVGVSDLSPWSIIFLRFGIAFLLMAAIFRKQVLEITGKMLICSFWMGLAMFATFSCLLYGLMTTDASSAGFFTGAAVVIVPLLELIVFRHPIKRNVWIAMVTVIAGIGFLSGGNGLSMGFGSWLCIMAAVCNAGYIVLTSHFSRSHDALLLGIWQLFFASAAAFAAGVIRQEFGFPHTGAGWLVILCLAVFCSAYGYVIQPVAQKYTSSEKTGFLLASEPVFSLIFASVILHERLSAKEAIGACLILLSIVIVNKK